MHLNWDINSYFQLYKSNEKQLKLTKRDKSLKNLHTIFFCYFFFDVV